MRIRRSSPQFRARSRGDPAAQAGERSRTSATTTAWSTWRPRPRCPPTPITPSSTSRSAPSRPGDGARPASGRRARKTLGTNYANVFGTDPPTCSTRRRARRSRRREVCGRILIASVKGTGTFDITIILPDPTKQVFDQNVARDAIQAMHRVTQPGGTGGRRGVGTAGGGQDRHDHRQLPAWFNGFTP